MNTIHIISDTKVPSQSLEISDQQRYSSQDLVDKLAHLSTCAHIPCGPKFCCNVILAALACNSSPCNAEELSKQSESRNTY